MEDGKPELLELELELLELELELLELELELLELELLELELEPLELELLELELGGGFAPPPPPLEQATRPAVTSKAARVNKVGCFIFASSLVETTKTRRVIASKISALGPKRSI
jgi:hypothetical protein